jgi:Ca2+-binding RTX toxin-like protein
MSGAGLRRRVLIGGLAFFALAAILAVIPLPAQSHSVNVWKPCTITGTAGNDSLGGTSGPDVICGLGGDDVIGGNGGADIIRAGPGNDKIQGDAGKDVLMGQAGNDWIWARDGLHDHVNGGKGYDHCRADKSIDLLRYVEAVM